MKKIDFMLTAFRDGFQSVYGARVFSADFLPVVEEARASGIRHLEAGGGAMYQSPYFYANEDAFDVMDKFRAAAGPEANLQTLARGINVVALDSQPSDMIKLHAQLFKKHGMTTIRNFDALNDVNNLIYSGQCIHEAGLKHEVTITMMELPPGCTGAHTPEFYVETLKKILDAGIPFDSVCFKDASGTSRPEKVFETIKAARRLLGHEAHIAFHSHETAGTGTLAYMRAIEAGANQVDLSLAPCSGGTCQPDLITMWHALRGTDYEFDIDINKVIALEESFKEAMKDYFLPPEATKVEPVIPFFPMPGGALTANTQMLRDNNLMGKYPEVIRAMGEAVAKGGFGTSVTPVSQFYFQQAFNNVMFGPWKKIAEGYGKLVLGYFGKTPVSPDPDVVKIAAEQLKLEPTTESPLAINDRNPKKGRVAAEKALTEAGLPISDENVFIAASCGDKGIMFLQGKGKIGVRKGAADAEVKTQAETAQKPMAKSAGPVTVNLNGKAYVVNISGSKASVNGVEYPFSVAEGVVSAQAAPSPAPTVTTPAMATAATPGSAPTGPSETVSTPMPGLVLRLMAKVGDAVKRGDPILILESMKMENPINSPIDGTVTGIMVNQGQQVESGAVLATVAKKE
jgi:pyruvate carboxylase subunit B